MHVEIEPMGPEQYHPSSGPEQSYLHFLKSSVEIPSSQDSSPALIPSLQIVKQLEGDVGLPLSHVHPIILPEQSELHLSISD